MCDGMITDPAFTHVPALVDRNCEVVPLTLLPITAERAGQLLPEVIELSRMVARYRGYLESVLTESMAAAGQSEKRVGTTLYELKTESQWIVDDEAGFADALQAAVARGDATQEEANECATARVTIHVNHTKANLLAKRIPVLNDFRRKVIGAARLRLKSSAS